jgi:hypothetical protein
MAEKLIKRGRVWYFRYTDANGKRVMRKGCTDKRATEEMAAAVNTKVARIRNGLIDPEADDRLARAASVLEAVDKVLGGLGLEIVIRPRSPARKEG